MSDIYEIIVEENDLELSFQDQLELVIVEDDIELLVSGDTEVIVSDDVLEILTDSEPGIPSGGLTGQVLAKKSGTHFDAEWVTIATKITVSQTAPPSPNIGDLWVDTN